CIKGFPKLRTQAARNIVRAPDSGPSTYNQGTQEHFVRSPYHVVAPPVGFLARLKLVDLGSRKLQTGEVRNHFPRGANKFDHIEGGTCEPWNMVVVEWEVGSAAGNLGHRANEHLYASNLEIGRGGRRDHVCPDMRRMLGQSLCLVQR